MASKMHVEFYDSLHEFVEKTHEVLPKDCKHSENKYHIERFIKGSSFYGYEPKLYNKYKEHDVKKEAGMMAGVMDNINTADFVEHAWEYKQRLEEGDTIDINRYLDGHEKFWCGVKRCFRNKQVVRVYIGLGGNCNRTAQELAVCGAVGVTVVEVLEAMGIGVELWGGCFSSCLFTNGDDGGTVVKMKDSNEFADLGMVNYICGNAHIFRNYFFRSWCMLGERDGLDTERNLGLARFFNAKDIGLDEEEERTSIIIPQFYDVPTAKQWLIDMFNGLKQKLEGQPKKEDGQ